jgi:16S rRNA (uracil1498-N3)-methyltransferase
VPGIGFLNRVHGKSANGIGHCAGGNKLGHRRAFVCKGFGILASILPLLPGPEGRAICRPEGVVLTPRLYIPELKCAARANPSIDLPDKAAHHLLTVLRCNVGQALQLFDGQGHTLQAEIVSVDKRQASVRATGNLIAHAAPTLNLHLVQGLALGDRMDWVIEKAVELGVRRITPWKAQRSQLKLDPIRAEKRLAHWRAIIQSACEQSGQNWLPQLDDISSLDQALAMPSALRLFGSLDTDSTVSLALHQLDLATPLNCTLFVGPEAGITAQAKPVRLGPRVLRTETAGLAALAALQILAGDWRRPADEVK